MILIADSGSTKTDYRLIKINAKVKQFESTGMNPYFNSIENCIQTLKEVFSSIEVEGVKEVYFYGAGCSSEGRKNIIREAFKGVFLNADINVEHDLLGAARAACGKSAGLAGILGTGSNCCLFDGNTIIKEIPSSGYVLGDEGGGVYMGKLLIKHVIENSLPEDLLQFFNKRYRLTNDSIINKIYKESHPNKFLASFSMFIFHHRNHPFINNIIATNFNQYFEFQVKRFDDYQKYPLNLVGSIAFYFQDIIRNLATDDGITIGTIVEKPIAGLTLFHHPNPDF